MRIIIKKFSEDISNRLLSLFKVSDLNTKVKITKKVAKDLAKLGMNWFNDDAINVNVFKPWQGTVIIIKLSDLIKIYNFYIKFINSGFDPYYESWNEDTESYIPNEIKNKEVLKRFPELTQFHKDVKKNHSEASNPDDDLSYEVMNFEYELIPGCKNLLCPSDLTKDVYQQYL